MVVVAAEAAGTAVATKRPRKGVIPFDQVPAGNHSPAGAFIDWALSSGQRLLGNRESRTRTAQPPGVVAQLVQTRPVAQQR